MKKQHKRRIAVAAGLVILVAVLWRPVRASIFGEENLTLVQQLAELMKIHQELVTVSEAAQRGADVAEDTYRVYQQSRAAVDELKSYNTDKFIRDFRKDVYNTYPGFEILLEGGDSRQVRRWKDSRARSPFTTYEMIGAVFGDLTEPLKDKAKAGGVEMHRARIWRYESAGALALANEAEKWTKSADEDALELYRLAADADAKEAQHLSARAMALIAVQNSHVIRLLSRNVRLDGVRGAMEWSRRVKSVNDRKRLHKQTGEVFGEAVAPPRMMTFDTPW